MSDQPQQAGTRQIAANWLVLLPLLSSAVVYWPILRVYFDADDFLNLYYIVNKPLPEYLLQPHGGHLLLTRNAIFRLFFSLFGPTPQPYMLAVWLTHLMNVALLFRLLRTVSGSAGVAWFATTLWGVCPVHAGTLGWYSVYGQVLVATFLLVVLNQAAGVAAGKRNLSRGTVLTWPLLLLLASTCFGIGIGIILIAPVAIGLLLPPSRQRTKTCLALAGVAVAMPLLYRGAIWLFDWAYGPSSEALAAAVQFGHAEISWHQMKMFGFLASYGITSLLLGFFLPPRTFPGTAAYLATAALVAAGLMVSVRTTPLIRRWLIALTLLAGACYAIIALGRSLFIEPDKLWTAAAQPRYQYVGTLALAAIVAIVVSRCCQWLRLGRAARAGMLVAWIVVSVLSYVRARPFIDPHTRARQETMTVLNAIRAQVAAAPGDGDVRLRNRPFRSIGPFHILNQVGFPGWAAVYAIFFPTNIVDGRRVYFVVDEPLLVTVARRGMRTADLIVLADGASSQ